MSAALLVVVALIAMMIVVEVEAVGMAVAVAAMTTHIADLATMIVSVDPTDVVMIMVLGVLIATPLVVAMTDTAAAATTTAAVTTITRVTVDATVAMETARQGMGEIPTLEVETKTTAMTIGPPAGRFCPLICSGAERSAK